MTIEEWAAGFSTIVDIAIIFSLSTYLIQNRNTFGASPYCIASALILAGVGSVLRNGWVWFYLLSHHEFDSQEKLVAAFPLVGSPYWLFGTLITALGLLKLLREFTRAYVHTRYCSGNVCWYVVGGFAALVPLISFWI